MNQEYPGPQKGERQGEGGGLEPPEILEVEKTLP